MGEMQSTFTAWRGEWLSCPSNRGELPTGLPAEWTVLILLSATGQSSPGRSRADVGRSGDNVLSAGKSQVLEMNAPEEFSER
jgi:hypothetical protein